MRAFGLNTENKTIFKYSVSIKTLDSFSNYNWDLPSVWWFSFFDFVLFFFFLHFVNWNIGRLQIINKFVLSFLEILHKFLHMRIVISFRFVHRSQFRRIEYEQHRHLPMESDISLSFFVIFIKKVSFVSSNPFRAMVDNVRSESENKKLKKKKQLIFRKEERKQIHLRPKRSFGCENRFEKKPKQKNSEEKCRYKNAA